MKFNLYGKIFDSIDVAKITYNQKPGTDTLTIEFMDGSKIEKVVSGDERESLKKFKESLDDARSDS